MFNKDRLGNTNKKDTTEMLIHILISLISENDTFIFLCHCGGVMRNHDSRFQEQQGNVTFYKQKLLAYFLQIILKGKIK